MPNIYDDYDVAGKEISSTYEGRHITLIESSLMHPADDDGFVQKGDPIVSGNIVGVAFNTAAADTDQIAIDTEGIWALIVYGLDDEGNSDVAVGDIIYAARSDATLSKISSHTTNVPFGIALMTNTVGSGGADVIAVKVHWDFWFDIYRDFLAGGAAEAALRVDVNDATELATGYGQGIVVDYNNTGDKTGDAEIQGIAIDQINSGNVTYMYGETIYQVNSGNPTVSFEAALSIYQDELGAACGGAVGIDIGLSTANSPTDRHAFMRMRCHNAAGVPEDVFRLEGNPTADYLINFAHANNQPPMIASSIGGNQSWKIRIRAAGVDYFIPLYDA